MKTTPKTAARASAVTPYSPASDADIQAVLDGRETHAMHVADVRFHWRWYQQKTRKAAIALARAEECPWSRYAHDLLLDATAQADLARAALWAEVRALIQHDLRAIGTWCRDAVITLVKGANR